MFIDQIEVVAKAGDGGDGVVRWRHEKFKPKAGPAGGNGGRGGDVYVRGVRDLTVLGSYTGKKEFNAADGEEGRSLSQHGKAGDDCVIDVPLGSRVTDLDRERSFEVLEEGTLVKVLQGGSGGLGNEYFKSSTNRSPQAATTGKPGEAARFLIEVAMLVDVGLVGMPNAGKSSLLNAFTNATSRIGAYPFTTTEPHLGMLYEFTLADIPGLIEGAAAGKGLGHTFLRHVTRTKMLLHLVALDQEDPAAAYQTIRQELNQYGKGLPEKEEWIVLTKSDLVDKDRIGNVRQTIDQTQNRVFVLSNETGEGVKELRDALVQHLRGA